jgi:hypothetical protein
MMAAQVRTANGTLMARRSANRMWAADVDVLLMGAELVFSLGAGDENRTRTISLGS